jgi:hypothetical protein
MGTVRLAHPTFNRPLAKVSRPSLQATPELLTCLCKDYSTPSSCSGAAINHVVPSAGKLTSLDVKVHHRQNTVPTHHQYTLAIDEVHLASAFVSLTSDQFTTFIPSPPYLLQNKGKLVYMAHAIAWTDLHQAAVDGDAPAVAALLLAGASVEAVDDQGCTALQVAAYGGHTSVVQLLLAAHAAVHAADVDGYKPLHWAAQGGHAAVLQLLLDAQAAVNAADAREAQPCTVPLATEVQQQSSCCWAHRQQ